MPRPRKIKTVPSLVSPNAAVEAYARVEPKLAALLGTTLHTPVPVDYASAVLNVLGILPTLRAYRAEILETLPRHPIDALDDLEDIALALWFANLVHTHATKNDGEIQAMGDEANRLREDLMIAAEALAHRDLLAREALAAIKRAPGQPEIAHDLVTLGGIFTENWGRIAGKTAVEQREVERALTLGSEFLLALTAKKHAARQVGDTADQCARAFTLLAGAYDSVRRALTYLRWQEGDVDSLAPSLLRQKPGRKPTTLARLRTGKEADESLAESSEEKSQTVN